MYKLKKQVKNDSVCSLSKGTFAINRNGEGDLGGRSEGEDQLFSFGHNEFEKSFDYPSRDVKLTLENESGNWRSDLA